MSFIERAANILLNAETSQKSAELLNDIIKSDEVSQRQYSQVCEDLEHYKDQLDKATNGGPTPADIKKIEEANWQFAANEQKKDAEIERLKATVSKIAIVAEQLKLAKASTYHNRMGALIEEVTGVKLEKRY